MRASSSSRVRGQSAPKQAGEAAIGEDLSGGLAAGAIVGFVVGVANALDFFSTSQTGLAEAAVDLHVWVKGGYLFGERGCRFRAEAIYPELDGVARRSV